MSTSIPHTALSDKTRLYAGPVGLGAKGDGLSFPLAGGPLSFSAIKLVLASDTKRIYEGVYPLTALTTLKADLPDHLESVLNAQVENLTKPRPAIGPLSFDIPKLMGILNITPDSFSDGGDFLDAKAAKERASTLFDEGADILDVGAESTRPGADTVPEDEERKRLTPVFELMKDLPGPVSIDTRKAHVMDEGVKAGALLINDVSALTFDEKALEAAKSAPGLVLMHAKGTPADMQKNPEYNNVVLEVFDYLASRIAACKAAGISKDKLVIDPGIGFGKTLSHNLALLKGLSLFQALGVPVLAGVSRKRFIGEITGIEDPKDRVSGSISASLFAISQGAQIVRCHDVAEMRAAMDVYQSITSFG